MRNYHIAAAEFIISQGGVLGLSSARLWDDGVLQLRDAGTLICQTVADGNVRLLEVMLRAGLDPDSHDYDGRTGQHIAASTGDMRILKVLLDAGCHPSAKDNFGRTPLIGKRTPRRKALALVRTGARDAFFWVVYSLNGSAERGAAVVPCSSSSRGN